MPISFTTTSHITRELSERVQQTLNNSSENLTLNKPNIHTAQVNHTTSTTTSRMNLCDDDKYIYRKISNDSVSIIYKISVVYMRESSYFTGGRFMYLSRFFDIVSIFQWDRMWWFPQISSTQANTKTSKESSSH